MKKIIVSTIILVAFLWLSSHSQSNDIYPEIGKPIPDFILKNITGYSKTEITYPDFKGKYVILDFWTKGCVSCVASFPHINELYVKFKDKVNIFIVGNQGEGIEAQYERFKKKQNLKMPAAFDSALHHRFVPGNVPYIIMIDNQGIVSAITSQVNDKTIQSFLDGKPFEFKDFSYKGLKKEAESYDWSRPVLIDGNGGKSTEFLYRSLLAEYKIGMPFPSFELNIDKICRDDWPNKGRLEGVSIVGDLFRLAYLGRYGWNMQDQPQFYKEYYNRLVLELQNDSAFKPEYTTGKNIYWYSLMIPPTKATPQHFMEIMQRDLLNYFGCRAKVENRVLPYWSITATEAASKNLTKGGKYLYNGDNSFIDFQNVPINKYFEALLYIVEQSELPIIDETGIKGNVDIKVNVLRTDFEEIKRASRKQGFEIKKAEKEFKVLVVYD